MNAAGYIRVSGIGQVDGTSLDVQRSQIEAYCMLRGLELTHIYCDAAVSGGKPIEERPEGSQLMQSVVNNEVQAIVVTKLDRGFRSTVDCLNTVDKLDKLNVGLHIIDLGGSSVDSQSPAGRFMLTVLAAAAEMERQQIKVRCNSGREKNRSENKVIGQIPYGYNVDVDGKTLVENPTEQEALVMIHDLKGKGYSLRKIANELNIHGYVAKKGGAWTHGMVESVLRKAA